STWWRVTSRPLARARLRNPLPRRSPHPPKHTSESKRQLILTASFTSGRRLSGLHRLMYKRWRAATVLLLLPSIAVPNSGLIQVTGVHFVSRPDSTRITIDTTG